MDISQYFYDIKKLVDEDNAKHSQDMNKFNIFSILDLERKEVKLHSRLLYALLNPKGRHLTGNAFLKLFLQEIFARDDMAGKQMKTPGLDDNNLNNVKISREKDNIDLLMQFKDGYTIIIENKIDADDQPEQLIRYYNTVKSKYGRKSGKIVIVYLTLFGYEPEEQSIGDLKSKVALISYESEINNWIQKCIGITNNENVLCILKQYKKTIEYLTNSIADEREPLMSSIGKYIGASKENYHMAKDISDGLSYAKRDVLMQFMTVIKNEFIKAGYSEDEIYFGNYEISEYYSKNRNTGSTMMGVRIRTLNENLFLYFGLETPYKLYYYVAFGQYKKDEYFFPEHKTIRKKYPPVYEKVEKAVWKDEAANSSRQSGDSIKWDYIYDENGEKYDFRNFSDNCIELLENCKPVARRIAKRLLSMIDNVNKELV